MSTNNIAVHVAKPNIAADTICNSADLDRINSALRSIDPSDRDTWLRMAMAIKSELGDAGYSVWNHWSQQAQSYDARTAKDVWKSIRADGKVKIGTLFHEAKANGWREESHLQRAHLQNRPGLHMATEPETSVDVEIAHERAETAKKAMAILRAASQANADHPYLRRKRITPVATLFEIDATTAATILGYSPSSRGEQLTGRLLVAPIKRDDSISTLELIDGDKRKTALAGRGTKTGGYWATKRLPEDDGTGLTLLIGEGVATVLSASQACGHSAVATLSSGNLLPVALAMRKRYPAATLIILADLVKTTGEADHHAITAAEVAQGQVAIPSFGPDRATDMTDFNDLFILDGADAVGNAIANATTPMAIKPKTIESHTQKHDSDSNYWPQPQNLIEKAPPRAYPLDALPDVIRAAVEEVAGFVKAPLPMVATSALAAVSLATQAHVDVQRAEKLVGPVGLFLLTIAESGERKSTCDGFFSQPIREYEAQQIEAAKPILKDYRAESEVWEAKRNGIKEQIRHLAKSSKPTDDMESILRDLEHKKPDPPKTPRLLYADVTPEALAWGLAKQWPSGGIVSAEAGTVFGSHGMSGDSTMRNMATLNQLWDGNSLNIDRKTSESFTVSGARLTVALQVQEPTLRAFFDKSGSLARGTGFLARFLVTWPESTQGHRPFTDPPENWPHLAKFHGYINQILCRPFPMNGEGGLQPTLLRLTVEAKAAWVEYHDTVEAELGRGGELCDISDVASKIADNAARLAALFHTFEHGEGPIGIDSMIRATRIAAWHLHEARRFFGEIAQPEEFADAARLDSWLIEYCRRTQTDFVSKNYVRQHGPLRNSARLDTALRFLEELSHLLLVKDEKRLTICINPSLLGVKP